MAHNPKHSLQVMIIFCFITAMAHSQTADTLKSATIQEKSEVMTARMQRELSLTSPQFIQVKKILTERLQTLGDSPSAGAALETVNQETMQKLAGILNDKQYTLYQELRTKKKQEKDKYVKEHPGFAFSREDLEMDF